MGVREGDEKYFVAIGKKYAKSKSKSGDKLGHPGQIKIGPDWLDVAEIADENNIRVQVGSWLGYTKEALQQKVYTLYQMQLIDQKTALKLLEFGDIDSIVQQTRIEGLFKKNMNAQQQQPGQVDQMDLAMTENDMMIEGQDMPVSETDDHIVHIAVHQEALGRGFDDIVGNHIAKHQVYMGQNSPIGNAGVDVRDQMRAQATQPQGMPTPEAPMGPPSGTQLPQQNLEQAVMQTDDLAAQRLGGL